MGRQLLNSTHGQRRQPEFTIDPSKIGAYRIRTLKDLNQEPEYFILSLKNLISV
jgi:hypothetical protein